MSWKLSTTLLCLACSVMPASAWQPPAPAYEVAATPRGNFVAWPAGMFEKTDVLAFAGKAESDLSSTGRISQTAIGEIVIKTKSSPPRMAAPRPRASGGLAEAPGANNPIRAMVMAVGLGKAAAACSGGTRGCYDASGRPCQEGQPGCRCGCARPVAEGPAAIAAFRQKPEAIPMIMIVPSEGSPAAVDAALQALAANGFYFKIELE